MVSGRLPKNVNQNYFDLGVKTDYELRRAYYTSGALFDSCTLIGEEGIEIRNSNRDLVQLVKAELDIEHDLLAEPRPEKSSYFVQLKKVPYLRRSVMEQGIVKDKSTRKFPKMNPKYICPFVRGFFDANALIYKDLIRFHFNPGFVKGLCGTLALYAHINTNGVYPNQRILTLGLGNTKKLYESIYRGLNNNDLYLQNKRKLLELILADDPHLIGQESRKRFLMIESQKRRIRNLWRIANAQIALHDGELPSSAARQFGFRGINEMTRALKKETGMTVRGVYC